MLHFLLAINATYGPNWLTAVDGRLDPVKRLPESGFVISSVLR